MLRDLYVFSQKTCLSTEKKHLTAKKRHLSITFAANTRCTYLRSSKSIEIYESVSYTHLTLPTSLQV